jgi:hypothetical protein
MDGMMDAKTVGTKLKTRNTTDMSTFSLEEAKKIT